jgi:hypothetical protein
MTGWIIGWTDRRMVVVWMDGWMDEFIDGWMDDWVVKCTDGRIDVYVDG